MAQPRDTQPPPATVDELTAAMGNLGMLLVSLQADVRALNLTLLGRVDERLADHGARLAALEDAAQ